MGLEEYNRKRDFAKTPEPAGRRASRRGAGTGGELRYLVQKHEASHLHYDFRLEWDGVLLSWAVPKGPSLDPKQRRLAVQVEDHPVDYGDFEGVIPEGEYGGGTVMLWDRGTWEPLEDDFNAALEAGRVAFALHGEKLNGRFRLLRLPKRGAGKPQWLLMKGNDEHARASARGEITETHPLSVKSGRDIPAIAKGKTTWKSTGKASKETKPVTKPVTRKAPNAEGDMAPFEAELATLVEEPPPGAGWIYESKLDGYRLLAHKETSATERGARPTVRLLSRRVARSRSPVPKVTSRGSSPRAKGS